MPLTPLDDPDYLPYRLDRLGSRVLMLRLSAVQRAAAAFLDERGMPADPQGAWVPLEVFLSAAVVLPRPRLDWIFHIGHCGSTLLSRLLETWSGCGVLREPTPLREIAALCDAGDAERGDAGRDADALLSAFARYWARPTSAVQRHLVKATSSCNVLIEPLLETAPEDRIVLLDMPLRTYLATLLKSPGSIDDARASATSRWSDLCRRTGIDRQAIDLATLDSAETCAMGWLAEQTRFAALLDRAPAAVLRVDFERLLAAPETTLRAVAAHFDLDPEALPAVLVSPWWSRYAKAGDHAYGRGDRDHDLALSAQRFGTAIEAGVQWVDDFSAAHPRFER